MVFLSLLSLLIFFACFLQSVTGDGKWKGLSYDPPGFVCARFNKLCENVLEDMGCGDGEGNRTVIGCPGWPDVENNIANFVGSCTCQYPIYNDIAGQRVSQELVYNRIGPEMSWMLEPWSTGPPYDSIRTYMNMCSLFLDRIDCPLIDRTAHVLPNKISDEVGSNFKCSCGTFTAADVYLYKLIIDKINDQTLRTMPVFSDPVTLTVPMSMVIVLLCGKLGAILAVYLMLPAIVGFLLAGESPTSNPMLHHIQSVI